MQSALLACCARHCRWSRQIEARYEALAELFRLSLSLLLLLLISSDGRLALYLGSELQELTPLYLVSASLRLRLWGLIGRRSDSRPGRQSSTRRHVGCAHLFHRPTWLEVACAHTVSRLRCFALQTRLIGRSNGGTQGSASCSRAKSAPSDRILCSKRLPAARIRDALRCKQSSFAGAVARLRNAGPTPAVCRVSSLLDFCAASVAQSGGLAHSLRLASESRFVTR